MSIVMDIQYIHSVIQFTTLATFKFIVIIQSEVKSGRPYRIQKQYTNTFYGAVTFFNKRLIKKTTMIVKLFNHIQVD